MMLAIPDFSDCISASRLYIIWQVIYLYFFKLFTIACELLWFKLPAWIKCTTHFAQSSSTDAKELKSSKDLHCTSNHDMMYIPAIIFNMRYEILKMMLNETDTICCYHTNLPYFEKPFRQHYLAVKGDPLRHIYPICLIGYFLGKAIVLLEEQINLWEKWMQLFVWTNL